MTVRKKNPPPVPVTNIRHDLYKILETVPLLHWQNKAIREAILRLDELEK